MKPLRLYIECGDMSVADQVPPRNEVLPPYSGRKKRFGPRLRKLRNAIKEDAEQEPFTELWNMHGAFWKEFYPVIGDAKTPGEFADKLYELNFHPGTEFPEYPERYNWKEPEKEIRLISRILQDEPLYGLLGGHNWPEKFQKNIKAGKRLSSGCGFMWGEHEPTDWIVEAISWQALLDEAPMCTVDERPVFIKNLIYSSEQASGWMKSGGQLLQCVWNASGKCIQKRSEDGMKDLPVTDDDSLKIKF